MESATWNPTIADLRRLAIAHSFFPPTTLEGALEELRFVQADPIRAPARAQDLTLRHRVEDYRAGDLERSYARLGIAEDVFVNYGFMPASVQALMHPRSSGPSLRAPRGKRVRALLEFVRERETVHPREVDAYFQAGTVRNYWGGSSNATTHLLDRLHYLGHLRIARREEGIRIYAAQEPAPRPADAAARDARIDALIDIAIRKYAPLPSASLSGLVRRLRHGVPQWRAKLPRALRRLPRRLAHARVDGVDWYWPADLHPPAEASRDAVRLLSPFDPAVWDRRRFELFWGWAYRFEAYTPRARRRFGYYALPMLWRDRVIGWGNLAVEDGALHAELGYVDARPPRDRAFARELEAELERFREFLGSSRSTRRSPAA